MNAADMKNTARNARIANRPHILDKIKNIAENGGYSVSIELDQETNEVEWLKDLGYSVRYISFTGQHIVSWK